MELYKGYMTERSIYGLGAGGAALESILAAVLCRTPAEHISVQAACHKPQYL